MLLYGWFRWFSTFYHFTPFYCLPIIKYTDIVLLFAIGVLTAKCLNKRPAFEAPRYHSNPFLVDEPIQVISEDTFGRKSFAALLVEKIQSKFENAQTNAIPAGIVVPWGSGKTSFSNMIKNQLNRENRLVIEFNPWRSNSNNQIITDFFATLIDELKKHNDSLFTTLRDYAKSLFDVEENLLTKQVNALADSLSEHKSKSANYDAVNRALRRIK